MTTTKDFLILLDKEKQITKIGSNTFGSIKDTYPDGREFVGYGIKPDLYVEETVKDYLTNTDPVLNKAMEYLTNKINNGKN